MVGFVHFSNFFDSVREILQVTVLLDHPVYYVTFSYKYIISALSLQGKKIEQSVNRTLLAGP